MSIRAIPLQSISAAALILLVVLSACRVNKPEVPLPHDSIAASGRQVPGPDSATLPTTSASTPPAPAVTGAPAPQLSAQTRSEVVADVGRFIAVIDSGNQNRFWEMLSSRSLGQIDRGELAARDTIWSAARMTLGDIRNRHISVLGGSPDSVALLIEGLRLIDSQRVADPVIVHLLRENGSWKIMYPGLIYPQHDMRK